MGVIFPIFAAVLQAGSFTLDKAILNIRSVDYKTYAAISFPLLLVISLIIFAVVRPPFELGMLFGTSGLLLLISLAPLIIGNLVFYRALKDDHLSEIETLDLLRSVPVIIVSSLIFTDERNFAVIIPALIASGAIIWSHWKNHRFEIRPNTVPYLVWILVSAPISAGVAKTLLYTWHPVSLEVIRNVALGIILGLTFRSSIKYVPSRGWLMLIATNILTAIAWMLFHYSYQRSGIVYTVLVFSLQPLLVYFASVFFLKEPFVKKKFIAFMVVLASIATAQFLR